MENAGTVRGATASTKPQMERVKKVRQQNQPPTFLETGMIFEDRKGRTQAVWMDEPKKAHYPFYFKAWMFFLAALGLGLMIDVTVPLTFLMVGPALCAWMLIRRAVPNPARPERLNKPQRVSQPRPATRYREVLSRTQYMNADVVRERIGDAERNLALEELGIHFAAGRLDMATHDARQDEALSAVYADELVKCLRELPYLRDEERRIP